MRPNRASITIVIIGFILLVILLVRGESRSSTQQSSTDNPEAQDAALDSPKYSHPLTIASLRTGSYPGSDITIERTLENGRGYKQYIASYLSEGLKIYALLTVPTGAKPENGWPVIVFNHGFIPPKEYRTTERYVAYVEGFAGNGYIVFRPDYRGHDQSEGEATGGYGSNAYTIDVLNATASIKKYAEANPEKIGMWGHSMGGHITLRTMVVTKDVKAGVIWAGVVASYPDLFSRWRRSSITPSAGIFPGARRWRQELQETYGTPEQNPTFWNSISANSFLADISGPIQLHHGTADHSVPPEFSEGLDKQLHAAGEQSELFVYPGDDHNLASSFSAAMQRSVAFFDKYLK